MKATIPVQVRLTRPGAQLPEYKSDGAAAFDLHAVVSVDENPEYNYICIRPGQTVAVPTGVNIFVKDPRYCLEVWERSGLGKQGIQRRGGLVDADYQGECVVMLTNGTSSDFLVRHGDRIAQAKITPVIHAEFQLVNEFDEATERGERGFGSTGS